MNSFKDCRLAPQITTSLSGVFGPHSHANWETSQEVIHHKISPQQVCLTVKFFKVGFLKRKVHLW